MKTATLTLARLHELSPDLTADFTHQLSVAVRDCKEKPQVKDPREVTVKLKIRPHPEDGDDVLITPVTTIKMPPRKNESIRARRTHRGQLQFDFADEQEETG